MRSYCCGTCSIRWPLTQNYRKCIKCWRGTNPDQRPPTVLWLEAERQRRNAEFNRMYDERERERARQTFIELDEAEFELPEGLEEEFKAMEYCPSVDDV